MHSRAKLMIYEDCALSYRKWLMVIDMICTILMAAECVLLINSPSLKENMDLSKRLQLESLMKLIIDIREGASF
jgi:hypothetical protein